MVSMPERDEDYCRVCKTSPCAAIAQMQQSPSVTMTNEQVMAEADRAIGDFIAKFGPKAAEALGLTKPKTEPRHPAIFDVEKKVGDFYFLEYRRTRLLQKARTILTNDAARAPYEPDITIPRDEMLKALEYGLNETEDKMVTELCELRDLIFEALGKLDYRPPIEAEA